MKEYKYKINGNDYSVAIIDIDGTTAAVEVNGVSYKVDIGDSVKAGQTVAILEAMKMENNINAECDGVITAIKVAKGDNILEGSDIVIIG